MPDKQVSTVVIGCSVAGSSTIFSILDILASVGRDWALLHGGAEAAPGFQASLRTVDGAPYWDINGRKITPDAALAEAPAPALAIMPDLHISPGSPPPPELPRIAEWVAEQHRAGAVVASVCSGALVLAEAGVLDDCEATTHWAFADALATNYPRVRVRRERLLAPAGEGHRVITAGGASAWADLLLYLIGRMIGDDEARRIAKVYLLEPHAESQLNYASLAACRQHDDRIVSNAQVWAAENYMKPSPVSAMSERSGLTSRSFLRRFKQATGQTPVEYVQTLRVEEAKQMLETSDVSIDDVAIEVGYSEPAAFRSAFRKHVGVSPSAYRKKWSFRTIGGP